MISAVHTAAIAAAGSFKKPGSIKTTTCITKVLPDTTVLSDYKTHLTCKISGHPSSSWKCIFHLTGFAKSFYHLKITYGMYRLPSVKS